MMEGIFGDWVFYLFVFLSLSKIEIYDGFFEVLFFILDCD